MGATPLNPIFNNDRGFSTVCTPAVTAGDFYFMRYCSAGENNTKFPENCFITLAKVSDFCYNVYRVGIGFDLNFHKKTYLYNHNLLTDAENA